ncbi:MAG: hypothetical protein KGO47_08670 [Cyanobacteria bacterium REEB417]|nr:hypothetical protein [Cyanobacteria bacterium REEB417]
MSGKPAPGSQPYRDGKCYRDKLTGKFVCPPGGKKPATGKVAPAGKGGKKPQQAPPQKPRKPPKGWFPMPDQRDWLRGDVAKRPSRKPGPNNRTA